MSGALYPNRAPLAYDPALKQAIRATLATDIYGGKVDSQNLPAFVEAQASEVHRHLGALYCAGEVRGDARVTAGGLFLERIELTPYGVSAMRAALKRKNRP